jgi:hypothetical protein
VDYNAFRDKADRHWDGFRGKFLGILHYGSTTQQFRSYGYVDVKDRFLNEGEVVLDMHTGAAIEEHDPYDRLYTDNIWPTVYRLHFASYGDIGTFSTYLLKTLYFFMAILTCFVIISGILIWLEARKRLDISGRRKKYNTQVGHLFLTICMSILPVTAAAFSYSKLLPAGIGEHRELALNCFYFIGWLLLALLFWYGQDNAATSRRALLLTGVLGLLVPVINGLVSGNWIWLSYPAHEYGIFFIDLLWTAIAATCLYAWSKMRKAKPVKAKESLAGAIAS